MTAPTETTLPPLLVTLDEAAHLLGTTVHGIRYRLRIDNSLRDIAIKCGHKGAIMFRYADLVEYVNGLRGDG